MYHSSYKYMTNLLTKGAYLLFCVECTKADDGKLPDIARRIKEKLTQCLATAAQCTAATFHSVSFSKPNPVWFGKVTPKNCVQFSKPIPVWFGKKKIDFARHRFQTKFRLVWDNLMTIVNFLKIPNIIVLRFADILIRSSPLSLAFISAI